MKKFVSVIMMVCLLSSVKAQKPICSIPLKINDRKTTFLMFPFSILHVDRGSKDVLAQQIDNAKNILVVKASIGDLKNTNLTVVTEDGAVYPFDIYYERTVGNSAYQLDRQPLSGALNMPGRKEMGIRGLENTAFSILNKEKSIGGIKYKKWGVSASVNGVYIKDGVIFYQLVIKNGSPIDYDIDLTRFYICDMNKSKRTASQEIEIKPIYVAGDFKQVKAYEQKNIVFALRKFTIPDAKILRIEIMEKNGGRHLNLKVNNNKIIKAEMLFNSTN